MGFHQLQMEWDLPSSTDTIYIWQLLCDIGFLDTFHS